MIERQPSTTEIGDDINSIETVEAEFATGVTPETPQYTAEKDLARTALTSLVELEELSSGVVRIGADEAEDNATQQLSETISTTDTVRDYLRNIGKYPLLNAAEEVELGKAIEVGLFAEERLAVWAAEGRPDSSTEARELKALARLGSNAKDKMTNSNLRLVVSIAKRYQGHDVTLLDLIQEGNVGLIRAVQKFDYEKGFKFSTYATWWIRQALTRTLADQSRTIRIPVHTVEIINKIARVQRSMTADLGYEPTDEQVAEEVEVPIAKLRQLKQYNRPVLALDAPIGDENNTTFGDLIHDEGAIDPEEAAVLSSFDQNMQRLLEKLDDRSADIIRARFGIGGYDKLSLDQIAGDYNLTRERIRQIEVKGLAKLRTLAAEMKLGVYLG